MATSNDGNGSVVSQDSSTREMTKAEIAAARSQLREKFWLLSSAELTVEECFFLSHKLACLLAIPDNLDDYWYTKRQRELMLELHSELLRWVDDLGGVVDEFFPVRG